MRLGWVVISCFAIIQGADGVYPRLRNEFNREEMIAWGLAELWGTSALHEHIHGYNARFMEILTSQRYPLRRQVRRPIP